MNSWTECISTSDANPWNRSTNMSFDAALGLGLIPSYQNCTDFIFREGECAVQAAVRDRELRQLRAGDVVNPVAIHRDQDCVALHGVRGCAAWCRDQGCGRTDPYPASGSGEADG